MFSNLFIRTAKHCHSNKNIWKRFLSTKSCDKNELKQGLITPGSNIDIVPLEGDLEALQGVAAIVMLAWNFEKEIEREIRGLGYNGPIIMPLPNAPRII